MEINDSNFQEEVIEKSKQIPILVDFWGKWCPPCLTLKPILEKLEKDYDGKFILAKLDVNENKEKAEEYNIRSIPNVKLFKDGKVVDEFVGAIPEYKVKEFLDKNL